MAEREQLSVIDADAHICEPASVWTDYVDAEFRDDVLRVAPDPSGREALWFEGEPRYLKITQACIPGAYARDDVTWDDILPGSHDPRARLAVMDDERLDVAVMFPSVHLLSGDIARPDVAAANARAYNRWIADFVATDPTRLRAVGVCPLQSIEEAVTAVGECAAWGLSGVTFRPERYNGLALHSETAEPLWAALSEHDLTACIHGSFGSHMEGFITGRYTNMFFTHMVCHPFEQMAAVLDIVAGGVLDRFPRLRVGFFESGLGWLPYWLERMNEHKESMGHLVPTLRREPTEIFAEQCFVTMEAAEVDAAAQLVGMGLGGSIMWGSDYPHYDCTFPDARGELDANLARLGPDTARRILDENPRRFYGL